jgi:RNA polymerase sigma-70 factor, ECF subfamily
MYRPDPDQGLTTRPPSQSTPEHTGGIDWFSDIVRKHQAGLRAYIRALGAQDAWVDDLAQEAFLVAYRRRAEFAPDGDFGRWLRGIARNLVLNERRKGARQSRLLQAAVADMLANDEEAFVLERVTEAKLLDTMVDCISRLPARSRDLLQRRYTDGLDATAVGERLKINPAAVRQALVRIRAIVRRCMESKLREVSP